MGPVPPMHEMTFWEVVKNSPEWVAVIASTTFAFVTTVVIIWQVLVMKRQGRTQNRLLRLQLDRERVLYVNLERERILKLVKKLHLSASCLRPTPAISDEHFWDEMQSTLHELSERLHILDLSVYDGRYDQWYFDLHDYLDVLEKAVIDDSKHTVADDSEQAVIDDSNSAVSPTNATRLALADADKRHNPIGIWLNVETAIRMESFEFKEKWDAELKDDSGIAWWRWVVLVVGLGVPTAAAIYWCVSSRLK